MQTNWTNKDRRIAFLSLIKDFIGEGGIHGLNYDKIDQYFIEAKKRVDWLFEQYPSASGEAGEPPKISLPEDEPPFEELEDVKVKLSVGDDCPQCQVGNLVEKKGVSKKNNKPYKFIGCDNYPDCRYIVR